jgi:hypothetical protein
MAKPDMGEPVGLAELIRRKLQRLANACNSMKRPGTLSISSPEIVCRIFRNSPTRRFQTCCASTAGQPI